MPLPLTQIPTITRPEHLVEFIAGYFEASKLPLEYVARYDEPLLPKYPAALVMSGPVQKRIHGTRTFLNTLRAEIYIMHAKMTESRATRNLEDLQLATDVVALLESDMRFGGRIINGFVESETPGAMPPRSNKGAVIVSTRLTWQGQNETRF